MKVLIVDDDPEKVRNVVSVLVETGISEDLIDTSSSVAGSIKLLRESEYGLLVLDLIIPIRLSEEPNEAGGARLLTEIERDSTLFRPEHIVGLTVSEEARAKAKPEFGRGLWTIVRYGPETNEWKEALAEKASYILARNSYRGRDERSACDILFICALLNPELKQLKRVIGGSFREFQVDGDHSRFHESTINIGKGRRANVVACAAPSMGLTAAAALTTKACLHFTPKILAMTGICAGRRGEVEMGDCIVASTTWDYGSGKFVGSDSKVSFFANPYQIPIDPRAQSAAEHVLEDQKSLDAIQDSFTGNKPRTRLGGKLAPMASGAAVQADGEFFKTLASTQVRKVAAIDMEAFAVAWASRETAEPKPICFIAKSVADFADEKKSDDIQDYCSFTSAAVAFQIAKRLLNQ